MFLKKRAQELTSMMMFLFLLATTRDNILKMINSKNAHERRISKIVNFPSSSLLIMLAKSILLMIHTPKTCKHWFYSCSVFEQMYSIQYNWQHEYTPMTSKTAKQQNLRREKYDLMAPCYLKSSCIFLLAQSVMSFFSCTPQQGQITPSGKQSPGSEHRECRRASSISGGYLKGSYQHFQSIFILSIKSASSDRISYREDVGWRGILNTAILPDLWVLQVVLETETGHPKRRRMYIKLNFTRLKLGFLFMRSGKTLSSKPRYQIKHHHQSSTIDITPNDISLRVSRLSHSKSNSKSMNATLNTIFRRRMSYILNSTSYSSPIKAQRSASQNLIANEDDAPIKQKLKEMKEDQVYHSLIKNRIKRLSTKRHSEDQLIVTGTQPEHGYFTIQNQTLHGKPRFEYLDSTSTYQRRGKNRTHDQKSYSGSFKVTKSNSFYNKGSQRKDDSSFLLYASDRKHQLKFKESRKCKTFSSANLENSKEHILRMSRGGTKERWLLSKYLQKALRRQC